MVRSGVSWLAADVTGLIIAGTATAGIATASGAATGAPPAAVKQWRTIFKAPKVSPAEQFTQGFTAVVATGKTTGFAFDGMGADAPGGETAWERTGRTGAAWKKVPFPGLWRPPGSLLTLPRSGSGTTTGTSGRPPRCGACCRPRRRSPCTATRR